MPTEKRTRQYPAEFRTQAVQLAITSGKSRRSVADELGVGLTAVFTFVEKKQGVFLNYGSTAVSFLLVLLAFD